MANEIGLSQVSGVVPDIVRAEALLARYAEAEIFPLVLHADAEAQKKGDRVSIGVMDALSVNAVGSGGSVTRQQKSVTASEILLDNYNECTVDIEDLAIAQSAVDLSKQFGAAMGKALAEQQDIDVLSEHSNITGQTAAGNAAEALNDAAVRIAKLRLDRTKVPKKDRFFALHPDSEADLLALARFSEAQATGLAKGLQIEGGELKGLYGIRVVSTPSVQGSGNGWKNLLLHKECVGVATQKNFRIVKLAKVQLSEAMTGVILYGVKTLRTNHGVVIDAAKNT